jgi:RNA-directed DNA polymerase
MKIEQLHIDKIKSSFEKMQTKEDFLQLLNQAKPFVYGEKTVPFELKQINWYSNPKLGNKRYKEFTIKKKSGSLRTIHSPVRGLKAIQKTLSFILQCVFEPHIAAHGFVRNKSIVDNARVHVGSRYVYNIDLKDFFPSIDQARFWKCLQLKPFNLINRSKESNEVVDKTYKCILATKNYSFPLNKKEKILLYEVDGFNLINGYRKITLKSGENIFYQVTLSKNKISTKIELFLDRSNYELIKEFVKKNNESASTDDEDLAGIFIQLIENTQEKLLEKNNRSTLANMIAAICCTEIEVERKSIEGGWGKEKRNVLPQGAPTSPIITNIVCQKLDYLLTGVANRFGLKYTRYADDITFSSLHNVYKEDGEFLKELMRIITEQNFHIKESKTRLQKDGYRKEVTGLLINDKVNVQKRYIKQLRMWLYYWERYGYEKASNIFTKQYTLDKGNVKKNPDMASVITGKLDYLKMVKGVDNKLFLNLKNRLDSLTGNNLLKLQDIETNDILKKDSYLIKPLVKKNKLQLAIDQDKQSETNTQEKVSIPKFHNPKALVTLLKKFSINDSALKYTTHSWDAGRDANMFNDLTEFLAIAKNQYNDFSFQLKILSRNLHGKINSFLFNREIAETGWGDPNPSKRIRFGWSSPELLEACNRDLSLNPEDFILPEQFQIQRSGKTLQKFKHIIDVFKNEIEVRDENSTLLNLILQKHDHYLISFASPIISNLENKTFYTDLQWLSKALDLIFEGIQKYPQHPNVEYSVIENNNEKIVLNILHRNSFKNGMSIFDDKLNLKRGDFSTIKEMLLNLCDWSVESEFKEGKYRINYLVSNEDTQAYEKISFADGFKHILTFYK